MLRRLIQSHQNCLCYSHSVVSLTSVGKVGQQLVNSGVELQALGMRSFLDIPRVLWQLVQLLRRSEPEIVQTWMYHADLLGGIAARLAGNRRIIWGIRTTDIGAGRSRVTAVIRRVCAYLSRFVPHTIVCAAEASRLAHIRLGYDANRMVVVPNGFEMSSLVATVGERNALRAQYGWGPDTVVIGTLGRFNPVKNHEAFVGAAAVLARKYPNVRFLMVGRGLETSNSELMAWIRQTGLPEYFVLLGERADAPVCLAAMDIYCLHSQTEGFPNVVGEAMAMGVPCVVTDVGDAGLLVGETGVVVPRGNTSALAQGLERLVEMDPNARRILGEEARSRIKNKFTMGHAREHFEAIYQRVSGVGATQCAG